MRNKQIKAHFQKEALFYDALIPKLIPNYSEQNKLIVDIIPFAKQEKIKVLDLGTGTGILAYKILSSFPQAKVYAFDLSAKMLQECSKNLAEFKERVYIQKGDFALADFGNNYDLIVSGLAIHHLSDIEKQSLFKKIFKALKAKGSFLNRDIILGQTSFITDIYHKLWCNYINKNKEDADFWFKKYLTEDIPATLNNQIAWLQNAGFIDCNCYWQYLNFAIFGGQKA